MVNPVPEADFSATPASGSMPLEVTFTDGSFSEQTIEEWLWDFGDGNTSDAQNPTHTYREAGVYDVSLTVTEADGDTDTETKVDYITVVNPVPEADFSATPASGSMPLEVTFTDGSFSEQTIEEWLWDFGDGNTSAAQNPVHIYKDVGNYTVSLVVTDVDGDGDIETRQGYIEAKEPVPVADLTAAPRSGLAPLSVSFTDLSTSVEGIVAREWDFGDGHASNETHPEHEYTGVGSYTVRLTVTEEDGDSDTVERPAYITVGDTVPEADFSAQPMHGAAPLTVHFTDLTLSGQAVIEWRWDFGDGESSTDQSPEHTYTETGVHTVSLMVTDEDGDSDSLTRTDYIEVYDNSPPYVPDNPAPQDGANGVSVFASFSWTGGDPDGDPVIYDLYLGEDEAPPLVSEGQTSTSYTVTEPLSGYTEYFWMVVTADDHGDYAMSSVWSFTTGPAPTPEPTSTPSPTGTPAPTARRTPRPEPTATPAETPSRTIGHSTPAPESASQPVGGETSGGNDPVTGESKWQRPAPVPSTPTASISLRPLETPRLEAPRRNWTAVHDISALVDRGGAATEDIEVSAPDGLAVLTVAANTTVATPGGDTPAYIGVVVLEEPLHPPSNGRLMSHVYSFLPEGTSFSPAAELTIECVPDRLWSDASSISLHLARYEKGEGWLPIESRVWEGSVKVTADVAHFSAFGVVAFDDETGAAGRTADAPPPASVSWSLVGGLVAGAVLLGLVASLALRRSSGSIMALRPALPGRTTTGRAKANSCSRFNVGRLGSPRLSSAIRRARNRFKVRR